MPQASANKGVPASEQTASTCVHKLPSAKAGAVTQARKQQLLC